MRMKMLSKIMIRSSILSLGMGLFKLLFYSNPEDSYGSFPVNAYVGGDAYNMQINSMLATAYFVLFGALLIGGLLIEILNVLKDYTKKELEVNPISIYPEDEDMGIKSTTGDLH